MGHPGKGLGWDGGGYFIYLFECLCNSDGEENIEKQREPE